jgi:hypothetical protein
MFSESTSDQQADCGDMMARIRTFRRPTEQLRLNLGEVQDFLWPTAAALWNLRWQARGLIAELPDIDDDVLTARFIEGSSLGKEFGKKAFRRSFLDTTWEDNTNSLARILLVEIVAIYESWCDGIDNDINAYLAKKGKEEIPLASLLQVYDGSSGGYLGAIAKLQARLGKPDPRFADSISRSFRESSKVPKQENLAALMMTYRYFKELRNAILHGHSQISERFASRQQSYQDLTRDDLGVREKPHFFPSEGGKIPNVSLRGAAALTDIVLRLALYVDATILDSALGQEYVLQEIKNRLGSTPKPIGLHKRASSSALLASHSGFHCAKEHGGDLFALFEDHGIATKG